MAVKKKIDILITDDHPLFRRSLRKILQTKPDLKVVGEAENGQVAVTKAMELAPDVVLMDVNMPVLGGIAATRHIKEALTHTIVIALSSQSDEPYVEAMLKAGASDYVLKSESPGVIERSIRKACSERDADT
jgi:two-component system, NarL family, response regulator DegU